MATTDLSTYSGLQAAIAQWLERGDLTDQIPAFIQLAETRMNRLLDLREAEEDVALTAVSGSRFIDLPAAYSTPLNLWFNWSWGREPLRFVPPELLTTKVNSTYPQFWAVDGGKIAFERPAGDAYSLTLRYTMKYALSDTVTTNALLTSYPDAYLFGSLVEAADYLRDPDLKAQVLPRFDGAMQEINNQERRSKSLATLSTEFPMLVGRRPGFNIFRGD